MPTVTFVEAAGFTVFNVVSTLLRFVCTLSLSLDASIIRACANCGLPTFSSQTKTPILRVHIDGRC